MQKGCTTDGTDSYETLLVTLQLSEELTEEEQTKLREWFKVKTGENSITFLCEVEDSIEQAEEETTTEANLEEQD